MKPKKPITKNPTLVANAIFRNSFASGFVQRLTSRMLSAPNCLTGRRRAWKLLAGITSPSVVVAGTFLGMVRLGMCGEKGSVGWEIGRRGDSRLVGAEVGRTKRREQRMQGSQKVKDG